MSQFLPDGPYQTQPPSGVADITPADSETTSADVALMQRVLAAAARNPNLIPADFMAYVLDWIQTQRLQIPIGQIPGFPGFAVNSSFVGTLESTTSHTLTDLATVGPSLVLGPGKYFVIYGADAYSSSSGVLATCVPVRDDTSSTIDAGCSNGATTDASVLKACGVTLTAAATTLTMKYQSGTAGVTASFSDRLIAAWKFANL